MKQVYTMMHGQKNIKIKIFTLTTYTTNHKKCLRLLITHRPYYSTEIPYT